MEVYFRYSQYLQKKYGVKTYKLPVNLPLTCPNRDGYLATGACFFCGEKGAGFESQSSQLSVKEQLLKNKDYIGEKYGAKKFIAYFQNFSNTYLPLAELKQYLQQALEVDDIVEISLSTRPDCVSRYYLKELKDLVGDLSLSLELGLQTVNYHILEENNRAHTLAEFIDTVMMAKEMQVDLGAHLILNLPGDDILDVKENAKIISACKLENVKLHALYIREGTVLAKKYQEKTLTIISLEEYRERVITFLEYLDPKIAVQRLLGRAPEANSLFVNWGHSWWKIHDQIIKEMKKRNTYQGKKFNYLDGKALKKFNNNL